jgi:hypothetical protein
VIGIVLGAIGLASVASTPWLFRAIARALPDEGLAASRPPAAIGRERVARYGDGVRYTVAEPYDYEMARRAARRARKVSPSGAPLRLKRGAAPRVDAGVPLPFRFRKRG